MNEDQKLNEILRATASADVVERSKALTQFLKAISVPVREGVFDGDTTAGIFNEETLPAGVSPEYPVDFIAPGTEGEFRAFTNPGKGKPPALVVSGDKLTLSDIGNIFRVEYDLHYARNARWNVVARLTEAFMAGFVKKRNDDCWHTILASMADRGMTVFDIAANAGQFTRKLFSLGKCSMARNSGGNSTAVKRGRLTNIWMSCEGIESILSWNLDQVPETVRSQMYSMSGGDNQVIEVLGVKIQEMFELGVNQEYQNYYVNRLGGALVPAGSGHTAADVEIAVGLDLTNRDAFVRAITQSMEIAEDPQLYFQQRGGFQGSSRYAVGVLDSRRGLSFSF